MDYEVFLLGRIKEEWDRTGDNETAVARGLQRTAGIITAAAAIMVAVFAAFTFARLTEVKELGFSLAAAVLIDATIVRIVLVPAAMRLLGRWNWWLPAWLDRLAPRIDLTEGEAGPPAHRGNRSTRVQSPRRSRLTPSVDTGARSPPSPRTSEQTTRQPAVDDGGPAVNAAGPRWEGRNGRSEGRCPAPARGPATGLVDGQRRENRDLTRKAPGGHRALPYV